MPNYQAGGNVDSFRDLQNASGHASFQRSTNAASNLLGGEFVEPDNTGGQSFFKYVADEVNAVLDTLFCEDPVLTAYYNPLYWVIFAVLYLLLLPGAVFHFLILGHVPVKSGEFPEERDLRGQGIYIALGAAIMNLPFALYGFTNGQIIGQEVQLEVANGMALLLTLSMIAMNCIGLAAISYQLRYTLHVFSYGCFAVVLFLIFMSLYGIQDAVEADYDTKVIAVQYVTRLILIVVYVFIYYQCSSALKAHTEEYILPEISKSDWEFAYALIGIYVLFATCIIIALILASRLDWGLF